MEAGFFGCFFFFFSHFFPDDRLVRGGGDVEKSEKNNLKIFLTMLCSCVTRRSSAQVSGAPRAGYPSPTKPFTSTDSEPLASKVFPLLTQGAVIGFGRGLDETARDSFCCTCSADRPKNDCSRPWPSRNTSLSCGTSRSLPGTWGATPRPRRCSS